ncbi:MAG: 30S ribosomal protein S12 methylthiotransferase RimO [Rikenellaceae bacterium]
MKKINVVTLGCSKNVVDSEHIMRQLEGRGYTVVHESSDTDARIVVINTCGFIGDAKKESIETILNFAEAKNRGMIDHLFVMGCLSERYKDELKNEIPEVDSYFGARSLMEVVEGLGVKYDATLITERILTTPSHYAYLKISEGCNRACSYCAIPMIRGKHVSIPMETLVDEARTLAASGVKELLVIAQDTTFYGIDLYGERKIAELMRRLSAIDGLKWIRLHYAYPSQFPLELIDVMRDEPKICHYIDIPFQHASNRQLEMMHRQTTKEQTQELINTLRREIPDIAIRTTLIVGHAEESVAEFKELLEFVKVNKFERLGVFPYSEEEGTFSALNYKDSVSQKTKEKRAEQIMKLQEQISFENNEQLVGREMKVIIDRVDGEYFIGRSQYDSPEVDQEVYVRGEVNMKIGEFYDVKVVSSQCYELYAEKI